VALGFAFDPAVLVKIIGVGMAASILLDVTITRLLLVPAALVLLGRTFGFQGRRSRPADRLIGAGTGAESVQPSSR